MDKYRVMVVEDEGVVAFDIQNSLQSLGYNVVGIAANGEEAIEKTRANRPDLLLMDIRLGKGMDGVEAALRIGEIMDVPVVYLTAYTDEQTMERAKLTAPFGYLIKPFAEKELQTTIEMALYKHGMEKRLRQREQWLATTLNSIGDGVIATSTEGKILFMNPVAQNLTAWKEEDALNQNFSEVVKLVDANGGNYPVNPFERALESGSVFELPDNAEVVARDGRHFPVEDSAAPIFGGKGEIQGVVLVFRDASTKKAAEDALRASEEKLRQSQKLESLGRLAGGIAHDFNNLLTAINGYSTLALEGMELSDPLHTFLKEILKSGERAAGLTRQLLAYSRKQILEPKLWKLNEIVSETEGMLRRLIGEDIALKTSLGSQTELIKVDRGQMEQIILNLVVNARDAMPSGGKLIIETANVVLGTDYAQTHPDVVPGPYVMLAVSDTGNGMTAHVKAHLFEPFFTTKEPGKGTGLGLSVVFGIVKQSGGSLSFYSEEGRGTTFRIYFPTAGLAGKSIPEDYEVQDPAANRGRETILLVEDEEAVRSFAKHALETMGYKVVQAANGIEALSLLENQDRLINLLITDVVMPDMGGEALVASVRRFFPRLPVIFISGYTEQVVLQSGLPVAGERENYFLGKPFGPADLVRKVRSVLDTESGKRDASAPTGDEPSNN